MDTDDSNSRDYIPAPLRLDDVLRRKLREEFAEKFRKANPDCCLQQDEHEAEIFVRTLEGYAAGIPEFKRTHPPEQKRRREKVRALAVAMENLHKAIEGVDSAALGFALWRGMEEVEANNIGVNPLHPGMHAVFSAASLRAEILPELAAFSCGVRAAADELPIYDFNFMLRTALAVEGTFFQSGIPFTISDSGFAAQCLRAVFQLGGLKDGRMDYWLKLARDSDDAMVGMIKRIAKRQKNADE